MCAHPFRAGFAVALAAMLALAAIPGCKKKDEGPTPPGGSSGHSPEFETSQKNLKQIGIAIHQHNDAWNGVPVGIMTDGKSIRMSLRVPLLPYLDQEALFKEFKLDEPWDSEHNKKLIPRMPAVYALPGAKPDAGLTPYRAFVGPKTNMPEWDATKKPFAPGYLVRTNFSLVRNRWDKTPFAAEVSETVIWTKPDELRFGPDGSPAKLDGPHPNGTNLLMWDGRPHFLPKDTPAETVKAMIDITSNLSSLKLPGRD